MRRALLTLLALSALLPVQAAQADLKSSLSLQMRQAGSHSGAYVKNLTSGEQVFAWRAGVPRVLASNTKLFTSAAALARFGTEGTLGTEVLGAGELDAEGVWRGDLYLRGGGDPTFGSRRFATRSYGGGATVEELAALMDEAGVERVTGRVYGDESRHDSLRGGPYSAFTTSIWVGPLSALSFNRGLATESGGGYQPSPPAFAAARLDAALEARGIRVRLKPRAGTAPTGAPVLASVESPPMETLVRLMNKPSDNFFAEMLLKDLAMQAGGVGTTAAGARLAAGYARRLGARVRIADGVARSRCVGKTGSLSNVSALSGYCEVVNGDTYAYSILMNGVYPSGARVLQDRMLQAIARGLS
jgi:D-alanyl-D-alanine carboxypeptidase/D-alanyl-D-alanine-endopeptidase (penicillin-binding protein 4)